MKALIVGALALCLIPAACETTGDGGDFGAVLGEVLGQTGGTGGANGALSSFEIESGLKQALTIGANNVAGQIGKTNGYFGDPQIKIPLPNQLRGIQENLQRVGLSGPLDDLELRMNRAAEQAVPVARDLVVDAVTSITLDDALGILRGGDTAATDYLRGRTEGALRQAFTPYVDQALTSSGAYQALDQALSSNLGLGGLATSYKSDLTTHAVNLGLDGLFYYVADEEKKIRENPVARTTELLRKVFGSV